MNEFEGFPKIPRYSRDCIISEKIDGTNGQILITEDEGMLVGSRSRWLGPTKQNDNHGFFAWACEHTSELLQLGPGRHFGEWWGQGIQRGYGLKEKRFSLFNVHKWSDPAVRPACCYVVPVLYTGPFETDAIFDALDFLGKDGSKAAPGFMRPEGIVIYHTAGNLLFKKTIERDAEPKGRK